MSTVSGVSVVATNGAAAASCREKSASNDFGSILPQAEWFAVMARERWKFGAPKLLQGVIEDASGGREQVSDRTCRAWTRGDHEPPARLLGLLLLSDDGFWILQYIMRNSTATWWLNVQHALRVAAALKQVAE